MIRLSNNNDGRSGGGVFGLCSLYDVPGVALAGEFELTVTFPESLALCKCRYLEVSPKRITEVASVPARMQYSGATWAVDSGEITPQNTSLAN